MDFESSLFMQFRNLTVPSEDSFLQFLKSVPEKDLVKVQFLANSLPFPSLREVVIRFLDEIHMVSLK